MFDPSPFVNPTPLAHADTSRYVLPRGGTSQWRPARFNLYDPELRNTRGFNVWPEVYFSGSENVTEFLEGIDNQIKLLEIPSDLSCAYLKGLLLGRALNWYQIFGSALVQNTATDFAQLKAALSKAFHAIQYRKDLETRFYASQQRQNQEPTDFIYDLLKTHKKLELGMSEKALVDHIFVRLEPQVHDYVEVRNPQNTVQLLEVLAKFEERYSGKAIRGSRNSDNVEERGWNECRMSNVGNQWFESRNRFQNDDRRFNDTGYQFRNRGQNDDFSRGDQRNRGSSENFSRENRRQMGRLNVLKVITAQGAKCQNIGVVELNIQIRECEKRWLFHVLADLEYPCILGIDFIGGSKIILDFDRKSLVIPDSQIDKVVKTVEVEKVEIDLSKTKLEEKQKRELQDLFDSFRINQGLRMFYIMRLTREITHRLFPGRTGIMSALDLRSGYFQMAVNPSDIVKTAFVTKNGTYAFRRMPFGLSEAAPNFQKAIDIILKPVIGKFVNVYMDDVIILFVEWAQNEIAVVPDFHKRILFSDEALFWLNGYVNKQKCRIWSEANPQVYVETPLHPEKLTVWCALWAGGIIGPYFFKNDEGHNVTVNGDRYRAMITNFFIPELNNHDVQELGFLQDGATCHTARATIDLLKDTFGERLISRFGPVNWPPISCDLTPLDYFLWNYVKSLVYADKPQTLDHLEDNIRHVIDDIRPQMLEKVIENWTSRLDYIRASRGSHMPEIIFKM
ncbi:uncharacterized protein TNCV_4886571 [Trichonephila clavipes]|uniref:Reverse transcriptase domain-containing protein n=1 Tax=Trichonephila clavipes TaxID=2585209 RepID=A0A8X6UWS1_TRICX|nr:uncharacterized protein TNCV_4886571 [Trichonephila clavipes]